MCPNYHIAAVENVTLCDICFECNWIGLVSFDIFRIHLRKCCKACTQKIFGPWHLPVNINTRVHRCTSECTPTPLMKSILKKKEKKIYYDLILQKFCPIITENLRTINLLVTSKNETNSRIQSTVESWFKKESRFKKDRCYNRFFNISCLI